MKNDQPLVSIVIPAFRVEPYIRKCVTSVLEQSYSHLEVLVVDDHSPDASANIVSALATGDHRLKVVRLAENVGVHRARSAGVSRASGEVIGFVDGDDWIKPNMIETMLQRLESDRADIVICSAESVSDDGSFKGYKVRFDSQRCIDGYALQDFCRLNLGSGVLWNKLYRRSVIVPPATIELETVVNASEDYIVNVGAFDAASRVSVVPESLYCYRENPDSASRSVRSARAFARLLRGYVACLEVYADRGEDVLANIDLLYRRQLRWDCYRVAHIREMSDHAEHVAESLRRLAVVRPSAVYSLVHVFDADEPGEHARRPTLSGGLRRGVRAASRLLRGRL